jgi:PII-like signaling protein
MYGFAGERTLMRIFISEADRHKGEPLYQVLLELLRTQGFAGATVLRGVAGFGANAVMHTDKLLRLSTELPLVIEVVDDEAKIQQIVPQFDALMQGGMITLEKARVIRYRSSKKEN